MKMPQLNFPVSRTVAFISVSAGLTLLGIVAAYLRRRRGTANGRPARANCQDYPNRIPNGDVQHTTSLASSPSSQHSRRRRTRTLSRSSSVGVPSSLTITNESVNRSEMSPQQLCQLGLECLHQAVECWEDAYSKTPHKAADATIKSDENENDSTDSVTSELKMQLRVLLKKAYNMEDEHRHILEHQLNNVVFDRALTASIEEMNLLKYEDEDASDTESFVSAPEFTEMTEKEEMQIAKELPLYHAGVLEVKHGSVPCRKIRTQMLHCSSDADFLAKLHCVRLAFGMLFQDETIRSWFIEKSKDMINNLILKANKDPTDFNSAYDDMIKFVEDKTNKEQIETELKERGVKQISFYDVAMDFIFLDAFVEMDNPPSSVVTVVNNRWLSNGFKETALSTAVWSVLKAKRRMLKFPEGFIARFYALSESVSPVLAWGFLGPDEDLNYLCNNFKDHILQFMEDIFNIDRVRYTTVEQLSDDIYQVAREHEMTLSECLAVS